MGAIDQTLALSTLPIEPSPQPQAMLITEIIASTRHPSTFEKGTADFKKRK